MVVKLVLDVIWCLRVGFFDFNCLIVSFMFMGFIGVGKIEFVKVLVGYFFNIENVIVRIDMSEYMEKFLVLWFVGVLFGYVGYEEGGQLIEVVCRRFYLVVLFDEIEKVYFDVFNILLQFFDDGRIIDF